MLLLYDEQRKAICLVPGAPEHEAILAGCASIAALYLPQRVVALEDALTSHGKVDMRREGLYVPAQPDNTVWLQRWHQAACAAGGR